MEEINEGKTPILQLFKEDDFNMVRCPGCGSNSGMHYYRVEIFEREENASFGLHITVQDEKVTQDQNITNNPA
jgi:hypothetical protein